MLRPTDALIDKYIRPLNSGKIGTLSYSDPETGSHFWYPISSGAEKVERRLPGPQEGVVDDVRRLRRLLRRADDEPGLHRLRRPVGLRHRQASMRVAAVALGRARAARQPVRPARGAERRGSRRSSSSARSATAPRRTTSRSTRGSSIGSASVWNGIALGAIDIAKRHTTRKRHVDVGMRVADYPTIQDYVGEAVMDTNACRLFVLSVAQAMDGATDDNTRDPRAGRAGARRLPALGVADQVRGGEERRAPRRQDAARLRRHPATSATWSSSATSATPRPAG